MDRFPNQSMPTATDVELSDRICRTDGHWIPGQPNFAEFEDLI